MEEPNVMINYATGNNKPWRHIENLFIDSGGYSFMKGKGEYSTSDAEYLGFVKQAKPEVFALRDYPCEPDVRDKLNRTVEEHQRMTLERHRSLLDLWDDAWWTKAQPVSVIQGWELEDYVHHLDQLRDNGVLTEYVGIGSVCRRHEDQDLLRIIQRIRQELGPKHKLHAFGVKKNILRFPEALKALDSADSMAYEYAEKYGDRVSGTQSKSFRDSMLEYLKFKKTVNQELHQEDDVDDINMRCEFCGNVLSRLYGPDTGPCPACCARPW